MEKIIRQGDVCLIRVSALPDGAIQAKVNDDVILAFGEVTGHAHRIKQNAEHPSVRVFDFGAERYIQVIETVALSHDEHAAIVLEKGIYRQAFQCEDFGEEVRRVAD